MRPPPQTARFEFASHLYGVPALLVAVGTLFVAVVATFVPTMVLVRGLNIGSEHLAGAIIGTSILVASAVWAQLHERLLPTRVTVGLDGVRIQTIGRSFFVSHHRIVSAHAQNCDFSGEALVLELSNGSCIMACARLGDSDTVHLCCACIRERSRALGALPRELESNSGKDGQRFAEELLALRQLEPTYRQSAVDPEAFWQVLTAPGVPAEMRIAAAAALGPGYARKTPGLLKAAIEALASPGLRRAVKRANRTSDPRELSRIVRAFEAQSDRHPRLGERVRGLFRSR